MKLVPFDGSVRKKLIKEGFSHIEIRETISDDYSHSASDKKVQMFKALDRVDTMPHNANFVPIGSDVIDKYLSDDKLNCYIVVPASNAF